MKVPRLQCACARRKYVSLRKIDVNHNVSTYNDYVACGRVNDTEGHTCHLYGITDITDNES